jgi:hypothetical protein
VIETGVGIVVGVPELVLKAFAFLSVVRKVVMELLDSR